MKNTEDLINAGMLEVICGPMKSAKTSELIHRVEMIKYMDGRAFLFVKPATDTRDTGIKSRFAEKEYECIVADAENPEQIFENNRISPYIGLVAIEEAQFFGSKIEVVVRQLIREQVNVIISGLDLDFRGEPFGSMAYLLSIADKITKLRGVCEYPKCDNRSTRTQRLINGKPIAYDSKIISIEDSNQNETYETRCLEHHYVPGKPE